MNLLKRAAKRVFYRIPIQYRHGRRFRKSYRFVMQSQWWSNAELREYQMRQLSSLLQHAYQHVPFYQRTFDEHGIKPRDIHDFESFQRVPFLTKEDIRLHAAELSASNIPRDRMEWETTGGSTAEPLGLFVERGSGALRLALESRQWNWMRFAFGDRYVVLRGAIVDGCGWRKEKRWQLDPKRNCLLLSTFDMTQDNIADYAAMIEEFRPAMIRGYPSALELFAKYLREVGGTINRTGVIRSISSSSETLFPIQRRLIEETFGCPVFDLYGNGELAGKMGECERHEGFHDFMEFGYTEILHRNGLAVSEEGEVGEMVVTGFTNYAFPIIRYKIGDLCRYTSKTCSCGRGLSLIGGVQGRVQELVVAEDGGLIPLGPVIFGIHDPGWQRVRQLRFVQEVAGRLRIEVVKSGGQTDGEMIHYVHRLFAERFKRRVHLDVHVVNNIETSGAGKHKYLIQKLAVPQVEN